MKKRFLFLPSLSILALTSCGNNILNVNFNPSYNTLIDIDSEEINTLIQDKEDFILLVTLSTCTTCQSAKKVFNEYISIRHVEIFTTYYSNIAGFDFEDKVSIIPSVLFFNDGNMIDIKSRKLTESSEVYPLLDGYIFKS